MSSLCQTSMASFLLAGAARSVRVWPRTLGGLRVLYLLGTHRPTKPSCATQLHADARPIENILSTAGHRVHSADFAAECTGLQPASEGTNRACSCWIACLPRHRDRAICFIYMPLIHGIEVTVRIEQTAGKINRSSARTATCFPE